MIAIVAEPRDLTGFDEVLEILRGLPGKLVEATVFLPEDDGGYGVAHVGGVLHSLTERQAGRWGLAWTPDDVAPSDIGITLWSERFLRAELTFIGEENDAAGEIGTSE